MKAPSRRLMVLAGIALAGALAGTSRAVWAQAIGPDLTGTYQAVDVTGGSAAPAVLALAVVGLAASLATALSSRWVRLITGPVLILSGLGAAASAVLAYGDPVEASRSSIVGATGIAGAAVQAEATLWPLLAALPALGLVGVGLVVLTVGGRWSSNQRYRRVDRSGSADRAANPLDDPAAAWDALSRGEDPTADTQGPELDKP